MLYITAGGHPARLPLAKTLVDWRWGAIFPSYIAAGEHSAGLPLARALGRVPLEPLGFSFGTLSLARIPLDCRWRRLW